MTATKSRPKTGPAPDDALAPFSRPVREWFEASFEAPTDAQARGWAAIAAGHHTLIHAPTGSGKTLAAFLWTLDRLATDVEAGRIRVPVTATYTLDDAGDAFAAQAAGALGKLAITVG